MPESESSPFSSVVKWVAGIVAAVAVPVLIWWLTGPNNPWQQKTVAKRIAVEGFVVDAVSNNVIAGAQVLVQFAGSSNADQTDSEGRYLFDVPPTEELCHLTILASGYSPAPYKRTFAISPNAQPLRVALRAALPTLTPGINPPAMHPVKIMPPPPMYVRRLQSVLVAAPAPKK
jgi:hypothetical protein